MQALEACGLIRSSKLGRTCSINPAGLRSAEGWIADRRTMVECPLDQLGEYLIQSADHRGTGWDAEPGEATSDIREQQ